MKFEILLAIIIGAVIGVGGMFLVATLLKNHGVTKTQNIKIAATLAPVTKVNVLSNPINNSGWDGSSLDVLGKAFNMPFVFLASPQEDSVLITKDDKFDATIAGFSGFLNISVFSSTGIEIGSANVLSYSGLPKNAPQFRGTVTDITRDGLQMKGLDGTLEQVAFGANPITVSFVKEAKNITPTDIAIGDNVAVVGERHEGAIIVANGVFVMSTSQLFPFYKFTIGVLAKVGKSDFALNVVEKEVPFKISPTSKFFGLKSDNSTRSRTKFIAKDIGAKVYVTQIASDSASPARSIFISE